jgi:hemin uptake protein HemP
MPSLSKTSSNDADIPAATADMVRRIKSTELFQQGRELEIEHAGRIYRLRVTQLNKLILTA